MARLPARLPARLATRLLDSFGPAPQSATKEQGSGHRRPAPAGADGQFQIPNTAGGIRLHTVPAPLRVQLPLGAAVRAPSCLLRVIAPATIDWSAPARRVADPPAAADGARALVQLRHLKQDCLSGAPCPALQTTAATVSAASADGLPSHHASAEAC